MGDQEEQQTPTPTQQLTREQILEKAKERLIAKDEKYIESLADMNVKLMVEKIRKAYIEQGRLLKTHQSTLEEHQEIVRQAQSSAKSAIYEVELLKRKLDADNDIIKRMADIVEKQQNMIEAQKRSTFSYKIKLLFKRIFSNKKPMVDL